MSGYQYSLGETPFKNRLWNIVDLEFVLLLTQKKERILVGSKHAIRIQLEKRIRPVEASCNMDVRDAMASDEEDKGAKFVRKIYGITDFLTEAIISNPIQAARDQREKEEMGKILEMPLLCDRTYDLGHFIQYFEYDSNGEWQKAIELLRKAMDEKSAKKRTQLEDDAKEGLQKKWDTADPVCQYVSLRIWREYLRKSDDFFPAMQALTKAFTFPPPGDTDDWEEPSDLDDAIMRLPEKLLEEDEQIRLWTPINTGAECVVVERSFIPLKLYYQSELQKRGQKFCSCVVCGKTFLSATRKKKTCSERCAKVQAKKTKASYDTKVRADQLEVDFKNSYQFWYNRVVKARKSDEYTAERVKKIEAAFAQYRKDSRVQKEKAKESDNPCKVFRDWAFLQANIIQNLMGE